MDNYEEKLEDLVDIEGFADVEEMLTIAVFDSTVPSICINDDCDYSVEMEPDQDAGYCEICGTQTVTSCLVLAGII